MRTAVAALSIMTLFVGLSACDRPERDWERNERVERERHERDKDRDEQAQRDQESDEPPEKRTLDHFEKIELRGAAELIINVGAEPSIELEGSRRAVKRIDVKGDTLIIDVNKSRGWFNNRGALRITVGAPQLRSLESNGAGEITIHGLNGGEHRVRLAGAHDVTATGSVDELDIEVSGAGQADYDGVAATNAKVEVNGAGEVDVNVTDTLRAEINGVGAVRYSGDPKKVRPELHGFGSISRRDGKKEDVVVTEPSDTGESAPREEKTGV